MATNPNLLFIFTDEQRSDTLGCYGNDRIQTPALNALAEESFIFEHAYCTQPVCTPARSTILTGLYPHTTRVTSNNIRLRAETPTIAELIPDSYHRAYYGKWHLGNEVIPQRGFDEWLSIEDAYRPYYSESEHLNRFSDYHHFLVENGFTPDTEVAGAEVFGRETAAEMPEYFTKAAFLGRAAADFISEHHRTRREQPFALYVNFMEPHMPFTGPFNDLYPPEDIPVGSQFLQPPPENASRFHRAMAEFWSENREYELQTEHDWRKIRAQYWGLVTLVDHAVENILNALSETGLADETIVVFTSDHGDMMGDHAMLAKRALYEEAVRVPLLVRVPWLGQGHEVRGRVSQVDLVPTLLDLLGQSIPDHIEGVSRMPVLRGEQGLEQNDVFIEWNPWTGDDDQPLPLKGAAGMELIAAQPWRVVISSEGWKLNLSPSDHAELYDLNVDPNEGQNLFDDPRQRDRIRDLAGRIRRWQDRTGDNLLLPVV